jgi:hypothetical protein
MLKNYSSIFFISGFLIACSAPDNEQVTMQIVQLGEVIPLFEPGKNDYTFEVKFDMPQIDSFENKDVMDGINFEINRIFFGDEAIALSPDPVRNFTNYIDQLANVYRSENIPLLKKMPKYAIEPNFFLRKKGSIVYNKNNILSMSLEIYEYIGGAHGLNSLDYYHFDLYTGVTFTLEDLLDVSEINTLIDLITARCHELRKSTVPEIYEDAEISSCSNFYVETDHFIFVYNPYEIAPYSAGYIKIDIPVSKIRPLLKKGIDPGF